jgi:hypothetical protein
MLTCKSPRKVMRAAHFLARGALPAYSSKFSRKDFTLPQLFACLVLREHQKKSYRGVEALLRDAPEWCRDVGLSRVPDHNTLCRAFAVLTTPRRMNRMLDVLARWFALAKALGLSTKPLAVDTTHFESRHASRHYERRRAQAALGDAKRPDKQGSFTRGKTTRSLPKAGLAVASACHLILGVRVGTGAGGDATWFEPLVFDSWRRAAVKAVVGDAGFDSESNHRIARLDMGVRSVIPPDVGRPGKDGKPPAGRYRRLMRNRFRRKADAEAYGQRWQVETVNSMVKRNLGSALRARTAKRREREMLLRAVTHNLMLARANREGSRQSSSVSVAGSVAPYATKLFDGSPVRDGKNPARLASPTDKTVYISGVPRKWVSKLKSEVPVLLAGCGPGLVTL